MPMIAGPEDAIFAVSEVLCYISMTSGMSLKATAIEVGAEDIRTIYKRALSDKALDFFSVGEEIAKNRGIKIEPRRRTATVRRGIEFAAMMVADMIIGYNLDPDMYPGALFTVLAVITDLSGGDTT